MTFIDDPIGRRGNVTADPELRYTTNGHAVATLTLACHPRILDSTTGKFRNAEPVYLPCVFWRHLAEHVATTVTKGTRLIVYGYMQDQESRRDGIRVTYKQLNAIDAAVSVRWATATVTKSSRQTANGDDVPL